MRRIFFIEASLFIWLVFCLQASPANELLENRGFEDPALLSPWFTFSNTGSFPIVDTIAPNSGASHVSATINGQENSFAGIVQTETGIITGDTYTFTVSTWAFGPLGIGAVIRMQVRPILRGFGEPPILLGDINCDGSVNLLDVGPFVEALSSGVFDAKADTNQDGAVKLLDVDSFIALIGS